MSDRAGIVYSTAQGRMCPACGEPVAGCVCRQRQAAPIPAGDGIVRVSRETKGRKGKGVTLIVGVPVDENRLRSLAKDLKRKCGAGGTVKDRVIEIQGDHRDLLVEELTRQGYTVKRVGG
ncbi:MAG: translation initiation factor Sui1 [Planctomycetota bacterium]|nr:translation initiation factor Sui1 [Planctomycetota bacterium]